VHNGEVTVVRLLFMSILGKLFLDTIMPLSNSESDRDVRLEK